MIRDDKFNIFLPFDTITKSVDEKTGKTVMKIGGVISNSLTGPDLDGETIDVEGMDFTKFLNKGFINYHHLASKDPSAIIGEPIKAYVKDGKAHFEGILYPESEMAQKVYDLANVLSKSSSTRKLGYSIEGAAVARDERNPKRIRKSSISGLAVTPFPKNGGTELTVLKGEVEYETLPDSDLLIDITDSNGVRWTVDKNLTLEKSEQSEELEKGGIGSGRRLIGVRGKGTNQVSYHKDDNTGKYYRDPHFGGHEDPDNHKYHQEIDEKDVPIRDHNNKKVQKAMEAGSITGTETHNQSLTQQPLKQESIAGTEGKKKKKKAKIFVNTELTKSEIYEYLIEDFDLDVESVKNVYALAEVIEKGGEGSRGGKVIGHTKSGKAIYEKPSDSHIHRAISSYKHSPDTLKELESHIDYHQKHADDIKSEMDKIKKTDTKETWDRYFALKDQHQPHENAIIAFKMAHAASKILQDHRADKGIGLSDTKDQMEMFSDVRRLLHRGLDYQKKVQEEE